ncbi:MAG: tetratricopeptide repeat protein [Magnetococcales bacterium]|nr:tetratricopeptide repeat protein [Magnetococcales bacterium]
METQELFRQGQRLLAVGNPQGCLDKLYQDAPLGEFSLPHLLTRAVAHLQLAHYSEALADCQAILRIDPENRQLYFIRGAVLRRMNRLDEAIANLDQALDLDPNYGVACLERSYCYRAAGRLEEADRDLQTALRLTEAALQGFCDTMGILRTQMDATESLVIGERPIPQLFLPVEEIEKLQQTLH